MTTWQKLKLVLMFPFSSFENISDYMLGLLNSYLAKTNVAAKVEKAREYVGFAFSWIVRLEPYCPAKWADDYAKIKNAVDFLYLSLDDGQISGAELQSAVDGVKIAYNEWME